jgi:hypothetical protein
MGTGGVKGASLAFWISVDRDLLEVMSNDGTFAASDIVDLADLARRQPVCVLRSDVDVFLGELPDRPKDLRDGS